MLTVHTTGIQRRKPKIKLADHEVVQAGVNNRCQQVRQDSSERASVTAVLHPQALLWDTPALTLLIFKNWTELNSRN